MNIKIHILKAIVFFLFLQPVSCKERSENKIAEDIQRSDDFEELMQESRKGNADAVLTLFRMSSKYKIEGVEQREVLRMMRKLAHEGNSEASLRLFRYYYRNPNDRPEEWRHFINESFKKGNVEAGFTILVLTKLVPDSNFSFSKSDLVTAKQFIEDRKNSHNVGNEDFQSGNLTSNDFDILFSLHKRADASDIARLFAKMSDEAEVIIHNYYSK